MAFQLAVSATGGDTQSLGIIDGSNYESPGEVGHEASNFSDAYVIQVLDSSEIEKTVLSDLAGADAVVTKPSESSPIGPNNSYVVSLDERYIINTVAVPTYGAGLAYVYSAVADVYVYDGGIIYKLLQSGTGQTPASSATYWEVTITVDVTDMTALMAALPSKYKATTYVYSSYDTEELWADMMYRVHTVQSLIGDDVNSLMNNREWKDAGVLFLDLRSLPGHLTNLNYEAMDDIFTRAAALLTKYA